MYLCRSEESQGAVAEDLGDPLRPQSLPVRMCSERKLVIQSEDRGGTTRDSWKNEESPKEQETWAPVCTTRRVGRGGSET